MRAYAIHRPLGPFTWPSEHRDKLVELVNYDRMTYVDEIRRYAFGHIDFSEDVPRDDLDRYELVTSPELDPHFVATGKTLARYAKQEDWERFERAWDTARHKYGMTDDEIERAMNWYED